MDNFIDFFNHTYIYSSYTKYQDYEFSKLINNYIEIEKELADDIKTLTRYFFAFNNYSYNGARFYSKSNNFICTIQFIESGRELSLFIRDDKHLESSITEIKIEHFGIIRKVIIVCPSYLKGLSQNLSIILEKFIITSYTNIERAVKDKFEHIADKICNRVNVWLHNHLIALGKKHLIEFTRFFVFQKNAGFFYFDKESYVNAIDNFKQKQTDVFSPYELAVWLLTNPLPFSKSLSSKSFTANGEVVSQEWDNAMFIDEKEFFEAARKLYDLKPYAVLSFCRSHNENFSLSIAFKRTDKKELVPILQEIKFIIIEQFNQSISAYAKFIKRFDLMKIKESIWNNPEIYGRFTGSVLASFFKITTHLH